MTYNADGSIVRPISSSAVAPDAMPVAGRVVGDKNYELGNHLGNVMVVVTDKRIGFSLTSPTTTAEQYKADVVTAQDYYAFGALMPGRAFNTNAYRYGMNGQEKDDEVANVEGANTSADYWEYDSRLGRRWNVDPIVKEWESGYATFGNNPIYYADPSGLDGEGPHGECPDDVNTCENGHIEVYGDDHQWHEMPGIG